MFGSRTAWGGRVGALLAVLTLAPAAAQAASGPSLHTDRGCYVVGQPVHITARGFAPARPFDLTVDGVDFGQAMTNSLGAFAVRVGLGGLAAVAQHVESLSATDGELEASAKVTLTARTGARILATRGNVRTLKAPVEVWDFSPGGARRSVYLHYVAPNRRVVRTVGLGRTGGQCGYLRTARRRVFPFTPASGAWTLQIDTHRGYAARPAGPWQRIRVAVG